MIRRLPMRCRIWPNVESSFYHHQKSCFYRAVAQSSEPPQVLASHPVPVSPARQRCILREGQKVHASFKPSSRLPYIPSRCRNDAFRLGQPLLWYIRSFPLPDFPHSSPCLQYQYSSSTPSPYYQRTDSWRAVSLPLS